MKNILEFLEQNASVRPNSTAFADENKSITYKELCAGAQKIGTYLTQFGLKNRPFAVLTHKSTETLTAMFGIVYSGNFYIVLDGDSPTERLNKILSTLDAVGILVDADRAEKAEDLDFSGDIIPIDTALNCTIDSEKLNGIRAGMIDTDPLYALFTSGSTGVPKGAVINHRNVIAYTEWFVKEYDITPQTVFGNQTPFYFSMSVSDVFATLRAGAQLQIIPKQLFSFPIKLIEWLNERAVNTIYWVPSALAIVANWKVLDYGKIEKLDKILFAGEVMPVKQLNYWRSHYPNA
ncbi:MAG: AMP-binding protein, partial [Clostridia bacterium]|nr:AMP-binding protein [Clostridia bacterium]